MQAPLKYGTTAPLECKTMFAPAVYMIVMDNFFEYAIESLV